MTVVPDSLFFAMFVCEFLLMVKSELLINSPAFIVIVTVSCPPFLSTKLIAKLNTWVSPLILWSKGS